MDMQKNEAAQIIQQVIDGATKSGLFKRAVDAAAAQTALNTLMEIITGLEIWKDGRLSEHTSSAAVQGDKEQ